MCPDNSSKVLFSQMIRQSLTISIKKTLLWRMNQKIIDLLLWRNGKVDFLRPTAPRIFQHLEANDRLQSWYLRNILWWQGFYRRKLMAGMEDSDLHCFNRKFNGSSHIFIIFHRIKLRTLIRQIECMFYQLH